MTRSEVKQIRQRLGLSQNQLSKLVGASQAAIWRWERGTLEVNPTYERLLMGLKEAPKKRVEKDDWVGMIAAGAALAAFGLLVYGISKKESNVKKQKGREA